MAIQYTAKQVVARLRNEIESGRPLFMPNTGMGLSAKIQEQGGADLVCVSPTSWWRLRGRGSLTSYLPYSDCNKLVFELVPEILAAVNEAPVISLSGPHNPLLGHREHVKKLWDMGLSGVSPNTIMLFGKEFAEQMEHLGAGFSQEVAFIRTANEMNIFTLAYAFTTDEAIALVEAGVDALSSHVGATTGGAVGARTTVSLEEAARMSQEIFDAATSVRKDVILFAHGGPMEGPEEVKYIFDHTTAHGFTGGSSAERMPIEKGILEATSAFKTVPIPRNSRAR